MALFLYWGWTSQTSTPLTGQHITQFGVIVVVRTGNYDFIYAHQPDPSAYPQYPQIVSAGQIVKAGTQIGWVDSTGNVVPPGPAGAHLHFGMFHVVNGGHWPNWDFTADIWVDPLPYLQGTQPFDPHS